MLAGLPDRQPEHSAAPSPHLHTCAAEIECAPDHSAPRDPADIAPGLCASARLRLHSCHRSAKPWRRRNERAPNQALAPTLFPAPHARVPCRLPERRRGRCSPSHRDYPRQSRSLSETLPALPSSRLARKAQFHSRSISASRLFARRPLAPESASREMQLAMSPHFQQAPPPEGPESSPLSPTPLSAMQ